jgi:hypothetical protein
VCVPCNNLLPEILSLIVRPNAFPSARRTRGLEIVLPIPVRANRANWRPPSIDAIGAARTDREQMIAARAYGLFLDRGMTHGGDVDDWLEAERQIDDELGSTAH